MKPAFTTHPNILTIDVGTSALKAVLYSRDGKVLGSVEQRYSYHSENPGWAEIDPEVWWQALKGAIADLQGQEFNLGNIEALSFTGQMHSAVLLDKNYQVIPPTILWLDRRATAETAELVDKLGAPPYELNSAYTLPKLLWLKRNSPSVIEQVHKILWPKDYLRFRLTGEIFTDITEPGGAGFLNWKDGELVPDRLKLVDLSPHVLPQILPASANGGQLLPEIAHELRINPSARVVIGMGDSAALYGGAPPVPGRVTCSLGSSSMVFAPVEKHYSDPDNRLHVYPFGPYPMLGGVSTTTGMSLTWAVDQFGHGTEFDKVVHQALEIEPGANGLTFIPYLAGERNPYWNDDIRGGFFGLRLNHNPQTIVRAVMEGVAYSLRHFLDLFSELGAPIREIALSGGGSTTEGWPQIHADVCQLNVFRFAGKETVTRVLFALCQENLGRGSFEEALTNTFPEAEVITPRSELSTCYDAGYQRYRAFAEFAHKQAQG